MEYIINEDCLDSATITHADATGDLCELVRCKDCKHRTLFQNAHGEWMVECENPDAPWLERLVTTPDWFCADGERR